MSLGECLKFNFTKGESLCYNGKDGLYSKNYEINIAEFLNKKRGIQYLGVNPVMGWAILPFGPNPTANLVGEKKGSCTCWYQDYGTP